MIFVRIAARAGYATRSSFRTSGPAEPVGGDRVRGGAGGGPSAGREQVRFEAIHELRELGKRRFGGKR
jgi:hypothetical protein